MTAGRAAWLFRLLLAGLGGTAVFLSFPSFDLNALAWIALVPIVCAVRGLSSARAHFLLGWFAGVVTNFGGFYWISGMLVDFGHLPLWLSLFLNLLIAAYQGLLYGLWLWGGCHLRRLSGWPAFVILPVTFVVVEYLLPILFPWYLANSQYLLVPVIQIAELGGVLLLSFFLVLANVLLADALEAALSKKRAPSLVRLGLAALVPLALCLYGWIRMGQIDARAARSEQLTIGLVEADVGIWEKEDPEKIRDNLVRHQRMSVELEKRGAELIVWPESSYQIPYTYARRAGSQDVLRYRLLPRDVAAVPQSDRPVPAHALEDVENNVPDLDRVVPQRGFRTPLLFGALTFRRVENNGSARHRNVDYLNSAILLDGQGQVLGEYDKVYLLMFGEYIPFGRTFPILHEWSPESGDLTPGETVDALPFGKFRLGVMICYEDILPKFTRKIAAKRPNVLINITNDAWFGKTAEPYLHLALAIFRSVENRVALVRSTNTGVSAFIDPNGRILSQTRLTEPETLIARLPMMEGRTPYQLLGDWPAYLSLLALAYVLFRFRARGKPGKQG